MKKERFEIETGVPRFSAGIGSHPAYSKTKIVLVSSSKDILLNQEKYAGKGREVFSIRKLKKIV